MKSAMTLALVSLLFALIAFGWALVTAADARNAADPVVRIVYETILVPVERTWQDVVDVETPVIDSMISDDEWDRIERESDCLFEYLQATVGWEITAERVLAAAQWLETLGGACDHLEEVQR